MAKDFVSSRAPVSEEVCYTPLFRKKHEQSDEIKAAV